MHRIDSMRNRLTSEKSEKNFDVLNAIGFEFRNSYPDSTIIYCQKAFALGKEINVQHDLARPLSFIGLAAAYKGDYKMALNYHHQAIQVSNEQNDTIEIAYAHNNLARMFIDEGDYKRAYNNLIPAHQLFQKINDKVGLAYIFRTYAELYRAQGEWQKALEASHMAFQLRKEHGLTRGLISALLELGRAYQSYADFDNAILFMNRADSVATILDDQISLDEINIGLAEIYATQEQIKLANIIATEVLNGVTGETNQKYLFGLCIYGLYTFTV
ncbi:MAG: tetratricopeptide repeat protein [Flammeovirgaceae bacterium]|nr:tetratricopeptide repeat protein [Flammeovirgaceae bacterium]